MTKGKRDQTIRVWALTLLWIAFLCSMGSGALAAEESETDYQPSLIATIQEKTPDVITTSKQRFSLVAETTIRYRGGKAITIRDLPVPCEAEVQYSPQSYGDPTVTKIVVRKVFPGATREWTSKAPE